MPHPRQEQRTAGPAAAAGRAAGPGRRRPGAIRGAAAGAVLILAATAVSACSGSSADALPSPDQANIKVGVISGSVGDVPFLLGVASGSAPGNGSFSKAGLNVTVQPFTTDAEEYKALDAGSIDIAYGEYGQFLAADDPIARSGKLQIVADGYDAGPNSLELMVRSGNQTPNLSNIVNQKNGTVLAVPSITGPEYISLADYFNSQGLPISSEVGQGQESTGNKDIQSQSDPDQIMHGVQDGQYVGAVLQEPWATIAEEQYGLVPAVNLATGDSAGVPLDGYFASSDFLSRFPKTAAVFTAVLSRLQAIGSSRTVVENALLQAVDKPSQQVKQYVATMQLGTYPTATVPEKISIVNQLMYNGGTIPTPLDISSLVYSAS